MIFLKIKYIFKVLFFIRTIIIKNQFIYLLKNIKLANFLNELIFIQIIKAMKFLEIHFPFYVF